MQNIYKIFSILFFTLSLSSSCIGSNAFQVKADSLFRAKKYTEAYELYDQIFTKNEASPAMLIKMAFIKEGLNDYPKALLYLSKANIIAQSEEIELKIQEIKDKHELKGYVKSDEALIAQLYFSWKPYLLIGLLSLSCITLLYLFWKKHRQKPVPIVHYIIQLFIIFTCFTLLITPKENRTGIILNNNALIMEMPSAGADLIEVSSKGHQIVITGEIDIWYEIIYDEKPAYIRRGNVELL